MSLMRVLTTTLTSGTFALNAAKDSAEPAEALSKLFDDLTPEFAAEILANPQRVTLGPARNQITVDEPPFRIEFRPSRKEGGAKELLPAARYAYYQRATAETVAENLEHTNNPAWKGDFVVIDTRVPVLVA